MGSGTPSRSARRADLPHTGYCVLSQLPYVEMSEELDPLENQGLANHPKDSLLRLGVET